MKTTNSTIISKVILPFLLAGVLAGQAAAASFQLDAAAREKIEAEAQRLIDEHHTPGIGIGIMSDGGIIYARGFGMANLETGTKVTPDSAFVIGSNTKQFTAVAIMLLSEQGKLSLDDPLSKYFPVFPKGDKVTLRHLLTHSSGIHPVMIPGGLPTPEQRATLRTAADLVPIIQGQINLYDFEPGTSRKYSNSGYILLGIIIEKISGFSLGEFFQQNLFKRAGMTASALDKATEVVPNRASGYSREPGGNMFVNPSVSRDVGTGGGGIRSTVGDMLRWQDALLAGRIISLEGVIAMTTPASENGGPFGVMVGEVDGHTVFSSGGGGPGFRSNVKMFPDERVAFVVWTNLGAPQTRAVAPRGKDPSGEGQPARKTKSPGKTGPGKKGPDTKQRLQGPPDPARELEQLLTQLIAERL
jgi:D-alanyl-D-alanine carboxypeptidase